MESSRNREARTLFLDLHWRHARPFGNGSGRPRYVSGVGEVSLISPSCVSSYGEPDEEEEATPDMVYLEDNKAIGDDCARLRLRGCSRFVFALHGISPPELASGLAGRCV